MAKKKNCGCTEKPWRRPPDYEPDEEWLPRCCPEEFVVEYDSIENFPRIGEKQKLYISTSDNSQYIWKEAEQPEVGGQYVKISNVITTKNGAITTPELSDYTLEFGTYTENKIAAKYATTTTGGAMSPEDKIKLDYLSNVSTLVIQPDFNNHTVIPEDQTAIENFFKKNKNFGGLLARNIISYDTSTFPYLTEWQLIGARHYTFHLEYVGGNLYNIELTIYFETPYIILSYTNVDLTNGFEAYGLTRTELGL